MTYGESYKVGDDLNGFLIFAGIILSLAFVILLFGMWVQSYLKKAETDETKMKKLEWSRKHFGPVYDFVSNVFWWLVAIYVVYLIWS